MKPNNIPSAGTEVDSEQKAEDASVRQHSSKPNVVCSAVGVPCEVCGEIIIVEKGMIAEKDCDIPPVCGKCYAEYYADYMQSLRTGYNY